MSNHITYEVRNPTHAVALVESCCHHFAGVLRTGTPEVCKDFMLQVEDEIPQGYHMSVTEIGHDPQKWKPLLEVEGVTFNGNPLTEVEASDLLVDSEKEWQDYLNAFDTPF